MQPDRLSGSIQAGTAHPHSATSGNTIVFESLESIYEELEIFTRVVYRADPLIKGCKV
jgi:hypothetical protein